MPMAFVNGKQVNLPSNATHADVVRAAGKSVDPGSRAVVKTSTKGNERFQPGKQYAVRQGDKFQIGPDRVKGQTGTYFGNKEKWRRDVIVEQVQDVSQNFFKGGRCELDDDCNWVTFDNFRLPDAWIAANGGNAFVKMMIIFPDQYPDLPTNGFYLPDNIKAPAADRHFFDRGYGGAFGQNQDEMNALAGAGWKWYCTHIKPDAWRPAKIQRTGDWRYGDNLWEILTLCKEVLTNPQED